MRSMRRNVDFGYLDRENPRKLLSDMAGRRTFRMRTNAGLQSVLCSCFIFKSNKDVFCEKVFIFVSAASSLLNCLSLSHTHTHNICCTSVDSSFFICRLLLSLLEE